MSSTKGEHMKQMERKPILMPSYLVKGIQKYADEHTFGNFSDAVRKLTKEALEAKSK